MSQGYNNLNRDLDILFGKNNRLFTGSNTNRGMMVGDSPLKFTGEAARGSRFQAPDIIREPLYKTPPTNYEISKANLDMYTNALKKQGAKAVKGAKVAGKIAGKAAGPIGTAVYAREIIEAKRIAKELEDLKKQYPDKVPQQAIDYYNDKARFIGAGMATGGAVGAPLGMGLGGFVGTGATAIGTVAGGLAGGALGASQGATWGGTAGEALNWLSNLTNPYKNWYKSEDYYNLVNGINKANETKPTETKSNSTASSSNGNAGYSGSPDVGPNDSTTDLVNNSVNANGIQNDIPQSQEEVIANNLSNMLDGYANIDDEHIQAIGSLIKNYPRLARDSQRQQLRNAALAGLSGNPYYANIKSATPLDNEIAMVNLAGELSKARQNKLDRIAQLKARIAIAKEMNMPAEAAFAEKELLKTYVGLKGLEVKLNNALMNYNKTVKVQELKNQGGIDKQKLINDARQLSAAISGAGNIQAYGGNGMAFLIAVDKYRKGQPLTPEEQTIIQQGVQNLENNEEAYWANIENRK